MSVTGGPRPSTVPFKNLNSFLFDGVDEKMFSTANYTELNGTQNFSISFWIKPIDTSNNIVWRIGTQGSNLRLACTWRTDGSVDISFNTSSYYFRTTSGSVPLNQWTHIVYTYDGTQTRYNRPNVHINGVDNSGVTAGVTVTSSTFDGTLELGGTGTSGVINFGNNYIDEFAVWDNTTLTETQSNELFNSGTPTDLNNIASGLSQPTTWFRMGDLSTWNGTSWIMRDVNGRYVNRSINMVEANRTTDVPPNPFVNTRSILLDGADDYVTTTSNYTQLDGQSKMTVSAWIKSGSLGSQSYLFAIGGGVNLFQVAVRLQSISSTNARCWLYISQATNSRRSYADLIGIKNDGAWHHLMVCLDLTQPGFSEAAFFLDGSQLTTNGYYTPGALENSGTALAIGNRENPNTGLFVGNMDEFAIWAGTDLRNDVATIYNSGEPNNLNNNGLTVPTTWYRCGDNDTAPTLTDNGSGGNDGTMTNFTTFSTDVPT